MKKLIVFTDLDGTLLDHETYKWIDAAPAIRRLQQNNYPLIFNSSKTYYEIKSLCEEMNNYNPMISENGSVIAVNIGCFEDQPAELECYKLHYFGMPYGRVIEILQQLRDSQGYAFRGFNDMSNEELMQQTGLSKHRARAAARREATEPLLWQDSEERLAAFQQQLEAHKLSITRGGRFYHVMSPVDKGRAIQWLLSCYQEREPDTRWISMGLGDSYNDMRMLESVDYPVLVKNPATQQPDVSHIKNIRITSLAGPAGWNQAVEDVLDNL